MSVLYGDFVVIVPDSVFSVSVPGGRVMGRKW